MTFAEPIVIDEPGQSETLEALRIAFPIGDCAQYATGKQRPEG